MNKDELKKFEQALNAERADVIAQIKKLEKTPDFGDDVDSLEEEADETEEIVNQLGIAQVSNKHLAEIDRALDKIKKGEYGTCEKCGSQIESKLLEVDPESRFCQICKQK